MQRLAATSDPGPQCRLIDSELAANPHESRYESRAEQRVSTPTADAQDCRHLGDSQEVESVPRHTQVDDTAQPRYR